MTADLERIAREAGLEPYADHLHSYEANTAQASVVAKFAALIAADCAKIADSTVCDTHLPTGVKIYGRRAGDAIRERYGIPRGA